MIDFCNFTGFESVGLMIDLDQISLASTDTKQ